MASRRNFLKSGSAAAALLGTMGLAGCSSIENALGGGGGSTSYKNWMYDPEELVDSEFVGFGTFNVQTIYENEDQLPDETTEELDDTNEQLSQFGVDLEETDRMTMVGHTGDIINAAMGGAGGGASNLASGGSVAITGTFEPGEVEEAVEMANTTVPEEQQMSDEGEYEGYNMWAASYEQQSTSATGETQSQTVSAAAGLSEESVLMGGMQSNEASAQEAVELMIDTEGGSGTRLTNENDDIKQMVDNVGGSAVAFGVTLSSLVDTFGSFIQEEAVKDVIDNLVAVGIGTDINGETYETNIAMVYDEAGDASTENYEAFFEYLREQNTSDVEDPLSDIETSKNGRTVVVTTTGDTAELFEASGTGTGMGETETTADLTPAVVPYDLLSLASPSDIVSSAAPGGGVDVGN